MPDANENVNTNAGGEGTPAPDPKAATADAVKSIADSLRAAIAEQRATPAVPAVVAPAPVPFDSAAAHDALATRFGELMAAGQHKEAYQFARLEGARIAAAEAASRPQVRPEDTPAVAGLIERERRAAKSANKDLFDRFGPEIEAEIARMPADQRVNPASWDAAIRNVRASHFDELIQEARTDAVRAATPTTPMAPGTRGRAPVTVADIDEDTIAYGVAMGYTPEKYAELVAATDAARGRSSNGIPRRSTAVLTDDVQPGRF